MSSVPVLTVRAGMRTENERDVFQSILVAVNDSGPAEAALILAAELAASGHNVAICTAIDTHHLHDMAHQYGYNPKSFIDDLVREARSELNPLIGRAGLSTGSLTVVEGETVSAILQLAEERKVDVILIGSHGRRGVSRLVLGSVAEGVVRRSPIPVLVVRL